MNCGCYATRRMNLANVEVLGHNKPMKTTVIDSSNTDRITADATAATLTYMHRRELDLILNIYGRMVSKGIWKDYAIDTLKDEAIFSIFKHAAEMPSYRIVKQPSLSRKQGMWRILSMSGQVLKRGRDLKMMLNYFNKLSFNIID